MPKPAPCISIQRSASDEQRAAMNGHHGAILWMTGLPAAGKSTIAARLERALFDRGYQVFVLDGDNVRQGLNADLDFSREDRTENIRRVGEVAALFAEAGLIVITAFISSRSITPTRSRGKRSTGVEMKFNRMVVYPGRLFHSPTPPFFGDSIENARLSQTMFINPGINIR